MGGWEGVGEGRREGRKARFWRVVELEELLLIVTCGHLRKTTFGKLE